MGKFSPSGLSERAGCTVLPAPNEASMSVVVPEPMVRTVGALSDPLMCADGGVPMTGDRGICSGGADPDDAEPVAALDGWPNADSAGEYGWRRRCSSDERLPWRVRECAAAENPEEAEFMDMSRREAGAEPVARTAGSKSERMECSEPRSDMKLGP